ncbi:MAG: 2-phospho-L-lactate guanylyltransferase [Microbacterium sp.]
MSGDPLPGGRAWSVVVPVKRAALGKSRLAVAGVDRAELARAIALDTLDAARWAESVAELVVVTDDPGVRERLSGADAGGTAAGAARITWVPDPGRGLDAAIAAGLEAADAPRRAAMLGDLPALDPRDLDEALGRAGSGAPVAVADGASTPLSVPSAAGTPGAVADADGTGTTLLADARPDVLRFGPDSFARHLAAGARPLDVPPDSTLRRDVDTAGHLAAARTLGLGHRTIALLG